MKDVCLRLSGRRALMGAVGLPAIVAKVAVALVVALASLGLAAAGARGQAARTADLERYLVTVISERDCVVELTVTSREAFRSELGFIATLNRADVNDVVFCGSDFVLEPNGHIEFLTEGGRLGEQLLVSTQTVELDTGVRQFVFLRRIENIEKPVLLDRRLTARADQEGRISFPAFGLMLRRPELESAITTAQLLSGARRTPLTPYEDDGARPAAFAEYQAPRISGAAFWGRSDPIFRGSTPTSGQIVIRKVVEATAPKFEIAPGVSLPISLPVALRATVPHDLLLFVEKRPEGWGLIAGDYSVWEQVGKLYYPVSFRGRESVTGASGLSESQIRDALASR